MARKIGFPNSNNPTITMSAVINFPEGFDEKGSYPAIVVSHPGGGVKEQTAGTYAAELAKAGFVTIAYDASYQGESGGEPRQLENPHIRTEDVSAVVDYLTTLPYVGNDRIGAMGICAGAGYSANAALQDHRIKALGTVSAVNIGSMFRHGWENTVKDADALPYIEAGSTARTADAASTAKARMPLAPERESDAPNEELRQAWEYYHTPRAECPSAPGFATARSLNQIITYDAYHKAEAFLTQPILAVAGSVAGSKWMSDDLLARAASKDKALYVVEGANHMDLYDGKPHVAEAVSALAPFFRAKLSVDASAKQAAEERRYGRGIAHHPDAIEERFMETVSIRNPGMYWDIAANIHFPPNFDAGKRYPAVISNHPIGSCKEQTSGNVYGTALATAGFVVIVPDASFQGGSGGEPRWIEDPEQRVKDYRDVIDYAQSLPYVDPARIGILGICGGGGYSIKTTIIDKRIKALVSITGVNFGRLMREGFSSFDPVGALEGMAVQRTAENAGGDGRINIFLPPSVEAGKSAGIADIDVLEATDYYRNRCPAEGSGTRMLVSHAAPAVAWDAFAFAETLLTQPMMVVFGDKPGGFGAYRDGMEIYARAASKEKELVVVEGWSHYDLYDNPEAVGLALEKLVPFFREHLTAAGTPAARAAAE